MEELVSKDEYSGATSWGKTKLKKKKHKGITMTKNEKFNNTEF